MPSRLNAVAETNQIGTSFVRKNRRISEIPRSGSLAFRATRGAGTTTSQPVREVGVGASLLRGDRLGWRRRDERGGGTPGERPVAPWRPAPGPAARLHSARQPRYALARRPAASTSVRRRSALGARLSSAGRPRSGAVGAAGNAGLDDGRRPPTAAAHAKRRALREHRARRTSLPSRSHPAPVSHESGQAFERSRRPREVHALVDAVDRLGHAARGTPPGCRFRRTPGRPSSRSSAPSAASAPVAARWAAASATDDGSVARDLDAVSGEPVVAHARRVLREPGVIAARGGNGLLHAAVSAFDGLPGKHRQPTRERARRGDRRGPIAAANDADVEVDRVHDRRRTARAGSR